jgi:hypothetical protein
MSRRKRKAASSPPSNGKKAATKKPKADEDEDEDAGEEDGVCAVSRAALGDFLLTRASCGLRPGAEEVTPKKSLYEDLLTPEELAAERERKKLMELEISLRLARDKTLSQTRAVMKYVRMCWSGRSTDVTHKLSTAAKCRRSRRRRRMRSSYSTRTRIATRWRSSTPRSEALRLRRLQRLLP